MAPSALRVVGKPSQSEHQHEHFGEVRRSEIRAVYPCVHVDGLPWDYGIHIYEDPPDQKKGEIQHPYTAITVVVFQMWQQRECGHHRNQMQEKYNVAAEWV